MFATEPRRRRQVRVLAKQIAEFGEADATCLGKRRCIREFLRRNTHACRKTLEQRNLFVFAAIKEVWPAAFAGTETQRLRLVLRPQDANIIRLRLACSSGRQAVDTRG